MIEADVEAKTRSSFGPGRRLVLAAENRLAYKVDMSPAGDQGRFILRIKS